MKKAISLFVVVVVCLSFCACTVGSKYVGTYKNSGMVYNVFDSNGVGELRIEQEIVLSRDGSGTLIVKALEDNSDLVNGVVGDDGIKVGDTLIKYTLTWEETENYISISGSGINYTVIVEGYLFAMSPVGKEVEFTDTRYELDGDTLVPVTGGTKYTKVR